MAAKGCIINWDKGSFPRGWVEGVPLCEMSGDGCKSVRREPKMKMWLSYPFIKIFWVDECHVSFKLLFMKVSFMQKNYIYSFRASVSHWAYLALLNLRVHRTQSLFAASMFLYFRGGRHRATRWVLRWRRLLVWGSQVAAWDRGTSWLGIVYL